MSNTNRPFGGTDPYDTNDPHLDARTDAPLSDADALDAWLDGIASHSGSSGTRSGNGRRRPNARIDDHDATGEAASIIETAARFHRRIDEAHSRDTHAAEPDPHLWETIMERTSRSAPNSVSTAEATANPWVAQPDTRQSQPPRPERRSRPRISNQQRIWNTVANIALVVAIMLAGFGVWRLTGEPGLPGGSGEPTDAPGFAMQASPTPVDAATDEQEHVVAPPVATPTPTTDCDFSKDLPIFNGVDESPWDGTAVLLTSTGDLVLSCPEEPEPTVLASDVTGASPLAWPGVIGFVPDTEQKPGLGFGVVSLLDGTLHVFGQDPEGTYIPLDHVSGTPWIIGPSPEDPTEPQIIDLRTMETRLLSEIAGTELPDHGGYLMSSTGDGALVLALQRQPYTTEGSATLVTSGLPGDVLVLGGSLDAASWISAPEEFSPIVGFEMSPDGDHIALHGASGAMREREHTWSIVSIKDGEEIARSATVETGPEPAEGVWTGSGFAYIDGNALNLIPTDPDNTEQPVFEGDGQLTDLRSTTDGSIVLVDHQWSDDLATMVANDQTPTFYSVDVTTGEATTFTGIDVSANTSPWPYPHRFLVTFAYQVETPEAITYQVIDATTGETVGTLGDVPLDDDVPDQGGYEGYPNFGRRSVVSSTDGETEIIAFDSQHIYLMQVVAGEPTVRQLDSPPGLLTEIAMPVSMFIAPDGSLLSLTGENDESMTRWLLPLDGEPDEWIEVPTTVASHDPRYILFVPGTGD